MKITAPLRVGIVGSGFVARLRADVLATDDRVKLVALAGNYENAKEAIAKHNMAHHNHWSELVMRPDVDLVIVATVNRDHAAVTSQALRSGKHVVVEYPLALDFQEAQELMELAQNQNLLLHVEHLELLGGLHLAVSANIDRIGKPFYVRYVTQTPAHPAPKKWTYSPELFGFPLIASVSRINRLVVLFGQVAKVSCQINYWGEDLPKYHSSCVCNAQLQFTNGVIADVGYSKGESFWKPERFLEIQGSEGAILFDREFGKVVTAAGEEEMEIEKSRGLFKRDTENVIAHLFDREPLYSQPENSMHSLAVACAAQKSAKTGTVVSL
ncbi:oxidoreductase domain protein [Thalassoporum mexicanum PCC 7367]|uniref:Gfo/Idh/MocA family protein n=1 Tax=Thalassoporum mexicanum TaxID=3457544 RepID=UPI00029F9FBA|nr:Gfo/Idh/MocA family oxidoreductase [Pseudanabaena sp. PCC 7367]AFY70473.1 oxidoreductase domain protein [Pseudanabaena sp. PCC 7367]